MITGLLMLKKMLISEEGRKLTVDEIALRSGFSSRSTFYRAFLKKEGITPTGYRNKNK